MNATARLMEWYGSLPLGVRVRAIRVPARWWDRLFYEALYWGSPLSYDGWHRPHEQRLMFYGIPVWPMSEG
jgi:hypothetical protein